MFRYGRIVIHRRAYSHSRESFFRITRRGMRYPDTHHSCAYSFNISASTTSAPSH